MSKKKVLLIRLDKIGDLICTLPVDRLLDETSYEIHWAVQKGLGEVVDLGATRRRYFELDKKNKTESQKLLAEYLKQNKFDYAISFQCPWWVNFELFKAQVPVRSGVKSQWHSFLFLNHSIRQKRSQAEKHELDYNCDLIYKTFNLKQTKQFLFFEIPKPNTTETLQRYNLKTQAYVVVHPGMMGSALNWAQRKYIDYIETLLKENKTVVITGTDTDSPYLTEIKAKYLDHPLVKWLQSQVNLNQLTEVLANAEFVLAPSTGVAHLAASCGTLVKGIYSPIRVHHPTRWAPRGPNVEITMIDPELDCH